MTPLSNSILSASATPGAPSPATSGSREQLAKAAKDFEAIFVRQMLSSARKASAGLGEDLFGNDATETFRDMQDSRLADTMAQSGAIGVADTGASGHNARCRTPRHAFFAEKKGDRPGIFGI